MAVDNGYLCEPECECRGIGYFALNKPVGHPRYGKVEMCPNVDRTAFPGFERHGLTPDEFQNMDYSSIANRKFVEPAIVAIESAIKGSGWVYVWGTFGVAKTFLLKAAIARQLRTGSHAAYVRMAQIMDNLRGGFNSDNGHESEERLGWWSNMHILAIDEIDRIRTTDYALERQFILMDRRYESAIRGDTVTILASNRPPEELAKNGDDGYLVDRIYDGRFEIVEIQGSGRRRAMGADLSKAGP